MDSGGRAIDALMAGPSARLQRALVVSMAVLLAALYLGAGGLIDDATDKAKRRSGQVKPAVVAAQPDGPAIAPAAHGGGFSTQVRLGFTSGDQWEPAIAADRLGHIYVLYAQYFGVPGCPECLSPTQVLTVSSDRGSTWSAPEPIQVEFEKGWDSQIAVDPVDGRTVWAAWLDKQKSDIVVARSNDFGANWTRWVVDDTNAGTDKPILAVRGQHVYVAYDHTQTNWVSYTHDGGETWRSVKTKSGGNGKLSWSLPGGGTVTPNGDVHFAWDGYEQSGNAKGPANIYVSSSRDGGATWSDQLLDVSGSPPDCSADLCGWAYLGAQPALASDAAGALYLLWNAGPLRPKGAPERMWFSRSTDRGTTWSAKVEVSTAPAGTNHAFPAIAAGAAGDVRIAWMDDRVGGGLWNTYYRSSTNGGGGWSAEQDVSTHDAGMPPYITSVGFEYPFGDYFEIDIDDEGTTHVINGQGLNYDSPGSIWYTRGD
ncbi:MAG TPA: sialidase family protein [Candidatus Limnocylindrales bacterium]|nr:sialidase family protein [Candidatus Limnocylindrales bacterium]